MMKSKNIFKYISVAVTALIFTSCNDFLTIYPTDKTIGEDAWNTKRDVDNMVAGVYREMISGEIQNRVVIWGAFRSDELAKNTNYSNSNLDNISAVNLLPGNGYNGWNAFYSVINRCNLVLAHAADVMRKDPNFTEGDYQTACAQMKALRSLCYFYLVRAFRDVPYTTQAYESDNQDMQVLQSSPDSVLQACINDLEYAARYVVRSGSYGVNDWRNVGYITRDAVHAILADIYLWRGSMTHNVTDYQKSIEYADMVIKAKHEHYLSVHRNNLGINTSTDIYHLYDGANAFAMNFVQGNSRESILEWQYDGTVNSNEGLENLYYWYDKDHNYSALMATQIFNSVDVNANTELGSKVYMSTNDYRYWLHTYDVNNSEAEQLAVRKFITDNPFIVDISRLTVGEARTNRRAYANFRQNWIVYRLTDVMLMKAEAQVQTATSDTDDALQKAFQLVQTVNKRSMLETARDTLKFDDYRTKENMERLVLAERERELCYEGKRWFDLMRFGYRRMIGVDIKKKMADQTQWPALPSDMLKIVVRKYVSGGDAVSYKMKSEPYLYFPVLEGETKVLGIKQNPVYKNNNSSSKN